MMARGGDQQRLDEHLRGAVGQHRPEHDVQVGRSGGARRVHVRQHPHLQRHRARDAEDRRRVHQADHQRQGDGVAAGHRDQRHGDDDAGKGDQDVVGSGQQLVQPAADVAGEQPSSHPHDHAEQHGDHRGADRGARPVDAAAEQVAAQLVGAEPMLGRRKRQPVGDVLLDRIVGSQGARNQRHEQIGDQDQDAQPLDYLHPLGHLAQDADHAPAGRHHRRFRRRGAPGALRAAPAAHQSSLIRGSSQPYSRSASRLASITAQISTMKSACTTA